MSAHTSTPEWSYMFDSRALNDDGMAITIAPNDDEKDALAHRLDIKTLNDLSADIALSLDKGGVVHVQGIIKAHVVQECVSTLEPVSTQIKEDFDAWYTDTDTVVSFAKVIHDKPNKGGERPILPEHEDPEPMDDGKIDLGELVTQFLILAIPAYPHAPGVMPIGDDPAKTKPADAASPKNPFAALKNWKDKQR